MKERAARRYAFTLVELLVVIGIIAVLISILLPTLGKARAQAATAACGSNLKQWYNAMLLYHNDYKSLPGPLLPATVSYEKGWNFHTSANWTTSATASAYKLARRQMTTANPELLLTRYFKWQPGSSEKWAYCPANITLYEEGRCATGTTYAGRILGVGYKINNQSDTIAPYFFGYWGEVAATVADPQNPPPKKLSQIRAAGANSTKKGIGTKSHADIWMMSDIDGYNWGDGVSSFYGIEDSSKAYKDRMWKPIHGSRSSPGRNYLFFDGSVRFALFQFRTDDNAADPYNALGNTTGSK